MNVIRKLIQSYSKEEIELYNGLKKAFNFSPVDINKYKKAFTHKASHEVDKKGDSINYERLEFLGDAILDALVSSYLFKEVPKGDEGYLTKMRSKIVSRTHLNKLGKDLNLVQFVKMDIDISNIGDNIHGNIFESLIGAIYLDKGYPFCEKFLYENVIVPYIDIENLEGKITSYKGLIIEWCQKNKKRYFFDIYEDSGNESSKYFSVKISIDKEVVAKGRATSKKKAEEQAAKRAYFAFQDQIINP